MTLARRNSSIHKIREYSLPKVNLEEEYEVLHVMQEGWRGRLLLVEHKRTRHEVVLKAIHKESTTKVEFFREFHYNYYLSPHTNILNAYDVAFLSGDYYTFAQEYAPFGDLTSNLSETGLGENNVKKISPQIVSALEFMHSKDLVHRNLNMDNILVFNIDFSEVKLCDFGSTRKSGTFMKKKTVWLPYAPPEIVATVQNEGFHVSTKQDVWQLGILIYVLLTGALPWQKADLTDPHYVEYINWRKRKTYKTPKRFSNFTTRALKMFKRLLEPKPDKRASVREVRKYLEDKWLTRPMKRNEKEIDNQSVCYSTFSIHSSQAEKDKVLHALKAHGIETTVDRVAKRKRIHEWIERSLSTNVMFEDVEEEDEREDKREEEEEEEEETENRIFESISLLENKENSSTANQKPTANVKPHEWTRANSNRRSNTPSRLSDKMKNNEVHENRGRIVIETKLDSSSLLPQINNGDHSSTTRESPVADSPLTSAVPTAFYNTKRRSSFQDLQQKSQLSLTQTVNRSTNNIYRDTHIPKGHHHLQSSTGVDQLSPHNLPHQNSPPKSSNQNMSNPRLNSNSNDRVQDDTQNFFVDRSWITNEPQPLSRLRSMIRGPRAVRSHSDRLKYRSQIQPRSKSNARTKNSDYDIQRSKTSPSVDDDTSLRPLSKHVSEDSLSKSDESLTSVIPMGFNC